MDPSPRCVTWGLRLLTVDAPLSTEIFVVRDVDVDESISALFLDMPNWSKDFARRPNKGYSVR